MEEQTIVGFQEPEPMQALLNRSKAGTKTKPGSSNFEKQEQKRKPTTRPVISGRKSLGQPGTFWFAKYF